ncbi:conserved hypothetical protein [Candidatus Nitrotoga sp. HW29]|uniref:hypothetical protein n=1 Tax=Candidatus Nitrotoga sp. HW29 TaxID=2886963 RepID=UPI001EF165D9|nr:hypothetical protein [Candidatus Nitrotoga sp. HW29]CAH1904557.1 conserved hypothetical protein [Candidatus Nitrotoga sp. HW29]
MPPAFKDVTFGNESTHSNPANTKATVAPDGSAISILFDRMQAQAGTTKQSSSHIRCDLTLILVSPIQDTTEILLDVRGSIIKTDRSTVSSTILIHKRARPLTFSDPDANGRSCYAVTLPKGAYKFNVSIAATAKAKYPESAVVAIDTLDVTFRKPQ